MQEASYQIHAFAILPEHLHMVIGWHPRSIRVIVGHLKSKVTRTLRDCGLWNDRQLWGEHGWNVRLEDTRAVDRAVRYTEANPQKEGKPEQHWQMVTPFDFARVVAAQAAWSRTGKCGDHDPIEPAMGIERRARRKRVRLKGNGGKKIHAMLILRGDPPLHQPRVRAIISPTACPRST